MSTEHWTPMLMANIIADPLNAPHKFRQKSQIEFITKSTMSEGKPILIVRTS